MLKDWFFSPRTRNFIKSGFFFDFFLKKIAQKILQKFNALSVFFLEKFIVEFIPKKTQLMVTSFMNVFVLTKTAFIPVVTVALNAILVIFVCLSCW